MAAPDNSYVHLMGEFRRHDNYDAVFRSCIDQLVGNVDLSSVKSCLALGAGCGKQELYFARRLLPNLRTFTAVEPDHESGNALRCAVNEGQLPGVETTVAETTMEEWFKQTGPVDAVFLFNVLCHVSPEDRRSLFQTLVTKGLNPGGIVAIIDSEFDAYIQLLAQLGAPRSPYTELVTDMLAAGFQLVLSQEIVATRDLSNISDDAVRYLQLHMLENKVTFEQVRAAIDDVYGQPKNAKKHMLKKLSVFKK